MVNIKPILTLIKSGSKAAAKYVQKPQTIKVNPTQLRPLRGLGDELCLSTKKNYINLDEVRALFPTGRLEDNYIIRDIKDLLPRLKTKRKIIDLTPELSEKDYYIIQKLMNRDNGRFIQQWKGYSDTDIVPNIQKLALFTRTMRLTKQTQEFLEFNPNQWEIIYEGIVKKPRETIMPLLEYKANSNPINIPLGNNQITTSLKNTVDIITEYLNMFTVKKDFIGYRGDKTFNILSGISFDNNRINLAEILERVTPIFKAKFKNKQYDTNEVETFVKEYLIDQKIKQKRFMSIGMTHSAIKNYAKKIKWNIRIPKGTKGASIESFNIERLNEAEFLGQRNGVFIIEKARYNPRKNLWFFDATLEQNPVDEIIVNC